MDFSDPGLLFSGLVISMVGLVFFMHGKRMGLPRNLAIGVILMILPVVVHALFWLWISAGACVAGRFVLPDGG